MPRPPRVQTEGQSPVYRDSIEPVSHAKETRMIQQAETILNLYPLIYFEH